MTVKTCLKISFITLAGVLIRVKDVTWSAETAITSNVVIAELGALIFKVHTLINI